MLIVPDFSGGGAIFRHSEIVLATAGLLLALSAPLLHPLGQSRSHNAPRASDSLATHAHSRDGELFAVISRLHSQLGESSTPQQVLRLIDSGSDVHGLDGEPPLVAAMGEGSNLEIVNAILNRGADINALGEASYECSTREDSTALMIAADQGDLDAVKLLLARGAEVDRRSLKGETALMAAVGAFYSHETGLDIVQLLLTKGADPKARDDSGNNLLHVAARGVHWGDEDLAYAHLFLDKGVDFNARNESGETPLHCVADCVTYDGYAVDIARLLLERGADPLVDDAKGRTPLDVAKINSPKEMVELLSRWTERLK